MKHYDMKKDKLRNQDNKCDTYVSMKKEAKDLYETLSKFTKLNENLATILSNKGYSLNKTRLCF